MWALPRQLSMEEQAMRHRIVALGVLVVMMIGLSAASAPQAAPAAKPADPVTPPADALVIYSGGIDKMLVDPKDQALLAAIKMIDARISELPNEIGDPNMPAAAIQFALQLLSGPMTLRAGMIPGADPNAGPPFFAQWNFLAKDQAAAENMAGRFSGLTAGIMPPGQPAPKMPGLRRLMLDGTPMYHGTIKSGDQPSFVLALNTINESALKIDAADLPKGVEPGLAFSLRASQMQDSMDMAFSHASPEETAAMRTQLGLMGLYGPNAMDISMVAGHGPDRTHATIRYVNYGKMLDAGNSRPTSTLTAADFKRIPADATYVSVSRFNLASIGHAMASMAPPEAEGDPMEMIEQQTGIHPQRDFFDHLGEAFGSYMSETTGGGGLLSTVAYLEVKNVDGLNQTMQRLTGMVNQLSQQHAKGYVRVGDSDFGGHKLTVLTFPGLPIPLEVCWVMQDGFLYLAATPQALIAAVDHAKSGKGSVADNPRFKEMTSGGMDGAMQLMFVDTPAVLRNGYGLASLGMSALANAVRSPRDPAREAGLIMPTFTELAKGAKATVYLSKLEGDDLVTRCQGDRSTLVNLCGGLGMMGGSTGTVAVAAVGAGLLLPALSKARETAKETKAATQLRQIGMAIHTFAADHDDALPPDLKTLIDGNFITEDLLQSPSGPAPDGGTDFWINLTMKKMSDVKQPDKHIMGYDRVMYANSHAVNVLFFDGHVEKLASFEFDALRAEEPNAGTDFDMPWED